MKWIRKWLVPLLLAMPLIKTLLKLLTVLLTVCVSGFAFSQMGGPPPPPHIPSLNVMAANSKAIVVGKVLSVEPTQSYYNRLQRVTVGVDSILKGAAIERVTVTLEANDEAFKRWKSSECTLVMGTPEAQGGTGYAIELSGPHPVAIDEDLRLYRSREAILDALKKLIKRYNGSPPTAVVGVFGPKLLQPDPSPPNRYGREAVTVDVPVDDAVEKRARRILQDPGAAEALSKRLDGAVPAVRLREGAVNQLANFKSPANIELLKSLLADPSFVVTAPAEGNNGKEQRRYMLRSAAYFALGGWSVSVPEPLLEETVDRVSTVQQFNIYYPKPTDNFAWLLAARNAKSLVIWESVGLSNLQIHDIVQLTTLEDLQLGIGRVGDEDFKRFSTLTHLKQLGLRGNPVTDASISTIAAFPNLQSVDLTDTEIDQAGYDQLHRLRPNLHISPEAAVSPVTFYTSVGDDARLRRYLKLHPQEVNSHDPSQDGNTPLHVAAVNGRYDTTKLLLDSGADVEAINAKGETPIWLAIRGSWGNRNSVIRLLLAYGADINHPDNEGETPLHAAIDDSMGDYGGNTRFLITTGANPFLKDNKGRLPLQLIRYPNGPEIDRLQALVKLMEQPVPLISQTQAECTHEVYHSTPGELANWTTTPAGRVTGPLGWSKAPLDNEHYLGPFAQQAVALSLDHLPSHKNIHVEVELWVLGSWDGDGGLGPGPDIIDLTFPGVGTAMHSTFFNCNEGDARGLKEQSFPEPYPLGHHLAHTGATRAQTLPFPTTRTAAYKLSYTFAHTDDKFEMVLTGLNVEDANVDKVEDDEHWGIASVTIKSD